MTDILSGVLRALSDSFHDAGALSVMVPSGVV
jgi:hypothetical protein